MLTPRNLLSILALILPPRSITLLLEHRTEGYKPKTNGISEVECDHNVNFQ